MEEEDDLDLGLEDELEKALEMEEGKHHVSHDLTISRPSQGKRSRRDLQASGNLHISTRMSPEQLLRRK